MPSDFPSSTSASSQSRSLLEAIEAGDREAFRRLFERYSPGLRKAIAARMDPRLSKRIDPSDILQETEMEVLTLLALQDTGSVTSSLIQVITT